MTTSTLSVDQHIPPTNQQVVCQNCDHTYSGQFCNQCGQQALTHRIDWRYLWHEVTESLWGVDRGILFTLRELLIRPGHSIREFLAGRRVNHYRPLALLLMLAAIYVFVSQGLHVDFMKTSQGMYANPALKDDSPAHAKQKEILTSYFQFLDENQQFSDLAMVPFVALWCWLLFRRIGYNYPEQLVAHTFIANFNLLFSLVMVLAFWVLGDSTDVISGIMGASLLIQLGYIVFAYVQLYQGKLKPLSIALRSMSAYLLGYASFILFTGLIVFVYTIVFMISSETKKTLPKKTVPQTSQHAQS